MALYFWKKKYLIKKHYKKTISIILGTMSWKIVILFICLFTKRIKFDNFSYLEYFNYIFTSNMLNNVPAEHLWFMYSLIRIYLIYPFIRYMYEKNNRSLIYIDFLHDF